tara:strand:- start:10412 stop:11020 length:609 start_codon:yes stop_codon:yes gene_type:complete
MALDSDVHNPDDFLSVTFYECTNDPYKGVPFIRIMSPGDQTNIRVTPVTEEHKRRFAKRWLAYQMETSGEQTVPGIRLETWHKERPEEFSEGQLYEMSILKFQTVEQIAGANDAQIQRIGLGGPGLRERAKAFVSSKRAAESGEELAKTRSELDELKAQMALLMKQRETPVEPELRRGPGRPRKEPLNEYDNNAATGAAGNG